MSTHRYRTGSLLLLTAALWLGPAVLAQSSGDGPSDADLQDLVAIGRGETPPPRAAEIDATDLQDLVAIGRGETPPPREAKIVRPPPPGSVPIPKVVSPLMLAVIPSSYAFGVLAEGGRVYVDRDFTFLSVPDAYEGAMLLRTANNHKESPLGTSFDLSRRAQVFVAHDQRMKVKPSWLAAFRDTGTSIHVAEPKNEGDVTTYDVLVRQYDPGRIHLGSNEGPKARKRKSMYFVFARPE